MRIGIDLDLCVIASDEAWYQYLQCICGGEYSKTPFSDFKETELSGGGKIDYNLSSYFPEPIYDKSDALNMWRGTTTYDTMKAVDGSVAAVTEMYNQGHEIVFISHVKGNSLKSKYSWLKRHFSFPFGFVATKEKHLISVDLMIDDRLENLVNFPATTTKILFDTPYKQTYNLVTRDQVIHDLSGWSEVLIYIKELK
jgi:5'(3')-deoxyribonucleotidase